MQKRFDEGLVFERIKRKHLLAIVASILLIVGLYKLVSYFFLTSSKARPVPAKVIQPGQPVSTQSSHVALSKDQVTSPSKEVEGKSAVPAQVPDSISSTISSDMQRANFKKSLEKMGSQLGDMQITLASLENKMTDLNNNVQQLEIQQQQWFHRQNESHQKEPLSSSQKDPKKLTYYVRAIVPGRAWLIAQDGSILTVGIGDEIPGYGHVKSIDPSRGAVILNTDELIEFSPHDR